MSEEESGGLIRTVTAPYRSRSDGEMSILGLILGLGLVIVVIPLLPFVAILWAVSKIAGVGGGA